MAKTPNYGSSPTASGNLQAMLNRGLAALSAGNLAEAELLFKLILGSNKKQFDALHMLGVIEAQRGNYDEALRRITAALRVQPNSADAHINVGRICAELSNHSRAIESYKKALRLSPRSALAHNNLSVILRRLGRGQEALVHCDKALEIEPRYADAWNNRGNILSELEQPGEALASYDRAVALNPTLVESYLGRANVLKRFDRSDEALAAYGKALAISPAHAEAWFERGNVLVLRGRWEEAFAAFDKAYKIKPTLEFGEGERLIAKLQICDWQNLDTECSHLLSAAREGLMVSGPALIFIVSALPVDQMKYTERYTARKYPASPQALYKSSRYNHDRIRIAYVSADFRNHATGYLAAGLFESHNRSRFETIGVSTGLDKNDDMRRRLQNSFDQFFDVRTKSDKEVAEQIRDLEIDIVVDLNGFARGMRPNIFARRAAPVQVNYLGYPGTMGASYYDYIFADATVIPAGDSAFYTEKIVYLPDTYQVNDCKRRIAERAPTRSELGLPDAGFVFCCFNNNFKIMPEIFDIWMRLLNKVEGSILWLLEDNAAASRNLRREAEKRGVGPERIVFATRMKLEDHLARHRLADLFLDTLPYNAHTTASDALWAGLPVLTCLGSTFAGRVAGSLLNALGLPELITQSLQEYETLATKLAGDKTLLSSIRMKLERNRDTFPLFDTERFTRHIEAAYVTMWERHQIGEPPESFTVGSIR